MKRNSIFFIVNGLIIGIIVAFVVCLNVITDQYYSNVLTQYLGVVGEQEIKQIDGIDANYVKSKYRNHEELVKDEEKLGISIGEEGIVLLHNNNLLPLSINTELSLFGHSSYDFIYGGSGSGTVNKERATNLKDALTSEGFKINQKLWSFYESGKGSKYERGVGSISYGHSQDWIINECPLSIIKSEEGLEESFNGTLPIFVISRTSGEGIDLPVRMDKFGGQKEEHYLEPDQNELEIISYLNSNFEDFIIILNCNNAFELGWSKNYNHLKAILNMPGCGEDGTVGLAKILSGKVSPSGRAIDTFVYDNFSAPSMANMGSMKYFVNGKRATSNKYYYLAYQEGIYVGYKYYETRYEDYMLNRFNANSESGAFSSSNWQYDQEVIYPFGYGLSYTSFAYENFKVIPQDDEFIVSLDVKNVGEHKGKEVVQIYLQKPYTDYDQFNGIEKSAVELVGFSKTKELEPNEICEVQITINKELLKTYDSYGKKTYILESGNYYFTAGKNAHDAIKNILEKKDVICGGNTSLVASYEQSTFDEITFANDSETNTPIKNLFDDVDIKSIDPTFKYLSRKNWEETFPVPYKDGDTDINGTMEEGHTVYGDEKTPYLNIEDDLFDKIKSNDSHNPLKDSKGTKQVLGKKNNVEAIELRGKDYDDPMWEDLLDELTLIDLVNITNCGYGTPSIRNINKPKTHDQDGPSGLNNEVTGNHTSCGYCFATESLLASTFNKELAFQMGYFVGEDGLYTKSIYNVNQISGWYGPAMNIHRTPFAGRNFEYYSEDSFLSAILAKEEVLGASSMGMTTYVKHFFGNDQECNRQNVICTWMNEQTAREIYLLPFEYCVKAGKAPVRYLEAIKNDKGETIDYEAKEVSMNACRGLMSSYNYLGTTWSGGYYNLLTSLLKEEWGFKGLVITDYWVNEYMNYNQMIFAGGDAMLNGSKGKYNDQELYKIECGKKAAKNIIYASINSAGSNGFIKGVTKNNGIPVYKLIIIAIEIVSALSIGLISFLIVRRIVKIKRSKAIA